MEVNGLTKSNLPSACLGGAFEFAPMVAGTMKTTTTRLNESFVSTMSPITPNRTSSRLTTSMDTSAATITPTASRENSLHEPTNNNNNIVLRELNTSPILRGVQENVKVSQARIRNVEDRISHANASNPQEEQQTQRLSADSLTLLKNQLFAENVCLIDALVLMGWEHYRWFLEERSYSFESASAAVRHIYEEALDVSIELFCLSPQSAVNSDRLIILLMVLDFDEYCETLLEYQLAREFAASDGESRNPTQDNTNLEELLLLHSSHNGPKFLSQLHELWKSGNFDRHNDPSLSEDEDGCAKVHAAGLCLVLFRKLESLVDRQQTTDLTLMEEHFRVLFDEYLPKQLTGKPSMNNIIATKYCRVLFRTSPSDGSLNPTVYWSLFADSYRKEWGEYFDDNDDVDQGDDFSGDEYYDMEMDTDDEDDGL